jgi:hypothetical protein
MSKHQQQLISTLTRCANSHTRQGNHQEAARVRAIRDQALTKGGKR